MTKPKGEPTGGRPPTGREPPDLEEEQTEEDLDVIPPEDLVPYESEDEGGASRKSVGEGEEPPIVLGADEQMEIGDEEKRSTWDEEDEPTLFAEEEGAVYMGKAFARELEGSDRLDIAEKKFIVRLVATLGAYIDKAMDEVFATNFFAGGETLSNVAMDIRRSEKVERVAFFINRHVEELADDFAEVISLEIGNLEKKSGMKISDRQKRYEVNMVFDKLREQIEDDVMNRHLTKEDRKFLTNLEFSLDKALSRAEEKLAQSP